MEWMLMPVKRYAEFSGRSRRKEYGCSPVRADRSGRSAYWRDHRHGRTAVLWPLTALFLLALLVPSISVSIRRLHDTDRRAGGCYSRSCRSSAGLS